MNELVSIIIPVYNVKDYLRKCLDSVIGQTYKQIEIILVDDGSNDGSEKIVDDYSETDNRIVVIHKENGGLSSARNAGIDIAKGDYITFVDSDDYIDRTMIEKMTKEALFSKSNVVICNRYYCRNGRITEKYILKQKESMSGLGAIKSMLKWDKYDMSAWAKLYDKSLFNEIRFPIGKISEDYFVMYKIFDMANRVTLIPDSLYYYVQRKGSITKKAVMRYDYIEAAFEQMKYLENKYPETKNDAHAAYGLSYMTVYNMFIRNGGKCDVETIKKMRKEVKKELPNIRKSNVSRLRLLQTLLFVNILPAYNLIIKITRY